MFKTQVVYMGIPNRYLTICSFYMKTQNPANRDTKTPETHQVLLPKYSTNQGLMNNPKKNFGQKANQKFRFYLP